MKVKAVWEFDVDISDLDPEFIDIPALAKDLTKREMQDLLLNNIITEDDFEYVVEEKKEMDKNNLPYTHDKELNVAITNIMNDWYRLVEKAKNHGIEFRFSANSANPLELYFHDDYPDMILVDKEFSCKIKEI